jgi:membrane-bound serine protease (ClpP class)
MNPLMDANVAYVLLVIGLITGVLALFAPGTGFLEVGALFAIVLSGIGVMNMEINPWALGVLVLGVVPFVIALRRWRNWIFLGFAIAAVVIGSVFLIRGEDGGPAVNTWLAIVVSLVATGLLWWIGRTGIEAIARRPEMDLERLIGMTGVAKTTIFRDGSVYVGGEEWSAWSHTPVPAGSQVKVVSRHGLELEVEAVED